MDFPSRPLSAGVSTRLRRRAIPLMCVAAFIAVVYLCAGEFDLGLRSITPHGRGVDPHLLDNDLGLAILAIPGDPPVIRATITNYHPETSVALLTLGTPLDDNALNIGLFGIVDSTTHDVIMIPRATEHLEKTLSDSLLHNILPRHAVTKDITLSLPALEKGHTYEVYMQGTWSAAWSADFKAHGAEKLKKLGGGFGLWQHSFRSENVTFEYV